MDIAFWLLLVFISILIMAIISNSMRNDWTSDEACAPIVFGMLIIIGIFVGDCFSTYTEPGFNDTAVVNSNAVPMVVTVQERVLFR